MIKNIAVYNRFNMDLVANNARKLPHVRWHLISISCPDTKYNITATNALINDKTKVNLESQGCNKILSLQFDDIRDDQMGSCMKQGLKVTLFSKEQAKQVVDFLLTLQEEARDSDLVVHCDAGISRSGAVAKFASDCFKVPFFDPHIIPNKYVLRMLWEIIDERKNNKGNNLIR